MATGGEDYIMSVPRWGGFTEIMPKFLNTEWTISDISGNHQIAVSLLAAKAADVSSLQAQELFRSRLVSDDSRERIVLMVAVTELAQLILDVESAGIELEHVFDY